MRPAELSGRPVPARENLARSGLMSVFFPERAAVAARVTRHRNGRCRRSREPSEPGGSTPRAAQRQLPRLTGITGITGPGPRPGAGPAEPPRWSIVVVTTTTMEHCRGQRACLAGAGTVKQDWLAERLTGELNQNEQDIVAQAIPLLQRIIDLTTEDPPAGAP
jgi:hypothetical protein